MTFMLWNGVYLWIHFEYCQALSCQSDDVAYPSLIYSWWYVADCCFSGRNSAPTGKYFYRWIRSIHPIESQKTIIQKYRDSKPLHLTKCPASMYFTPFLISGNKKIFKKCSNLKERSQSNKKKQRSGSISQKKWAIFARCFLNRYLVDGFNPIEKY